MEGTEKSIKWRGFSKKGEGFQKKDVGSFLKEKLSKMLLKRCKKCKYFPNFGKIAHH